MAFIELNIKLENKDDHPMLFNVNQIEAVKPSPITDGFSKTLIVCQNVIYHVSESYADVVNLINKTTTIGRLNLEKEAIVYGDSN